MFWGCSDSDGDALSPERVIRLYGRSYNLQSGVIWLSNPNMVVSSEPYVYEDVYVNDEGEQVTDRVEGVCPGDDQTETGNFMLSLYEEGLTYNEKLEKAQGKVLVFLSIWLRLKQVGWFRGNMYLERRNYPELLADIVHRIIILPKGIML